MLENNTEKTTLDLIQELENEETNPYFDDQTGLDLSPTQSEEPDAEKEEAEQPDEDTDFSSVYDEYLGSDDDVSDDWEYELPSLDPALAENPVLLKRAQDYEKGVKKLINRVKEKESELGDLTNLAEWNKALSDPETVKPALTHLVKELSKMYNLDVYDLVLDAQDNTQSFTPDTSDINALVEAKVQEKLKAYEEDLGYVRQKKQKEETESALQNYLKAVATKTIKEIASADNGWQIDEGMIREAVQALPNLIKDPVKAVRAYYSDERLAHYQRVGRTDKKGPTLTTQSNVGYNLPKDPSKISALDIMKMLEAQQ